MLSICSAKTVPHYYADGELCTYTSYSVDADIESDTIDIDKKGPDHPITKSEQQPDCNGTSTENGEN